MASTNVDQETAENEAKEPVYSPVRRGNTWRKQPSVLERSRYKIGKGEEDFVD